MAPQQASKNTVVTILSFQVVLIVLFAIFVDYHPDADASTPAKNVDSSYWDSTYPMFQDVHVMIFVGFGFLMTFLKKYSFSSIGITMLIAAMTIQWGIICYGCFRLDHNRIHINIDTLLTADVIAAAVLISFGAVLGKVSPMQLTIMAVLETVIFCINEYLGTHKLQAIDAGGSMYVHVFGAYFGLSVSMVLSRGIKFTKKDEELEGSSYMSDVTAMIGTIFLWLFWPSFNGALVSGDDRHRAIINTYLSLASCCVITFCISAFFNKESKFDMVHIQNATLAGGVCIGTAADLMVEPYGALLIGAFAGVLSTLGFRFLQAFLHKSIGLHDTCGVNNLHGMPGIAAGLIGALMAAIADESTYGVSLYETFPARSPLNYSKAYMDVSSLDKDILPGDDRSAFLQAGYQLLALVMSFVVAVVGGLITGYVMLRLPLEPIPSGQYNDDCYLWSLEENGDKTEIIPMITSTNGTSAETKEDIAGTV